MSVYAQAEEVGKDSLLLNLSEVEVNATSQKLPLQTFNKGRILWELENINTLPQILGQADPIRYSQTFRGYRQIMNMIAACTYMGVIIHTIMWGLRVCRYIM